jgi:hypothetical protein
MMMNQHHHPSSSSYRGGSTTAGTTTAHHHASTAPPPTRRASPRRAGAASRWCAIGLLTIFTLTTFIDDVLVPRARKHWDARPVPRYESLLIEREVPKTLHTLTLRGDVPFPLNYTARMNPNWTTQTYDVARGRAYMELKCPEHAEAYKRLKPVAFKADLLRYCILYSEGGVWMDDDILLLKSLDALTANMRRDHLFAFDRRVYKLVGGPGQIWNAFMVAVPGSAVFKRAMVKISENVANEHHFYHSLYYTGPALLYECAERTDSIEFRWRVQHRDAMSSVSRRVADVETDEEVLLHFKLPRASKHYSQMSRANDIYEDAAEAAAAAARKILAAFATVGGGAWV